VLVQDFSQSRVGQDEHLKVPDAELHQGPWGIRARGEARSDKNCRSLGIAAVHLHLLGESRRKAMIVERLPLRFDLDQIWRFRFSSAL
jgi:hypothetical protein